MSVCECGPDRCAMRDGAIAGGRGHVILCRRHGAGGDDLLGKALSGIRVREPLGREVAEMNIRLAAHIMAVDVGVPQTLDVLRALVDELEMMAKPVVFGLSVDEAALGASVVDIERLLGEVLAITRTGMEYHFSRQPLVGEKWLATLAHIMAAQDHARIAGAFLGIEAMPAPTRTTTPTVAPASPAAGGAENDFDGKPHRVISRRPLSRRRPR